MGLLTRRGVVPVMERSQMGIALGDFMFNSGDWSPGFTWFHYDQG